MVTPEDFRITDFHYGRTARIDECRACSFKQCVDLDSVLSYYEDLDDPAYDEGREPRRLQAAKLLDALGRFKPGGRLLDIGAASGILVGEARRRGYEAEGIEPSRHMARRARAAGQPVHLGLFPHAATRGSYDAITLVDVIEHVSTPVPLLEQIGLHLQPDGVGLLTTPNVDSLAARLLGRRWWHFRVAHIGYYSRRTLRRALESAGLEAVEIRSPRWYFPADYAARRALSYLPARLRVEPPSFAKRWTIAVNFHDSLQVVFRRKRSHA